MAFYHKYYPDYGKLYPGETLTPELIAAARQSDRERKRIEYDLKHGKPIYRNVTTGAITDKSDPEAVIADYGESREISLEMLLESGEKAAWFVIDETSNPLNAVIRKERIEELYRCLALLSPEERRLLDAIYYKRMNETEYGKLIGLKQRSVNYRKHCILAKLKKLFWAN
jgi:RNA polymerase sigma factor (sigma-70 family)